MTSPQPQARDELERLVERLNAYADSEPVHRIDNANAFREAASTLITLRAQITAQARELEVMRGAFKTLIDDIEQTPSGTWFVGGTDPELTVCNAYDALNSGGAEERASPPSSQSSGGEP